eukprot:220469-Pleurochrysis_carterae.AAC.1
MPRQLKLGADQRTACLRMQRNNWLSAIVPRTCVLPKVLARDAYSRSAHASCSWPKSGHRHARLTNSVYAHWKRRKLLRRCCPPVRMSKSGSVGTEYPELRSSSASTFSSIECTSKSPATARAANDWAARASSWRPP